MIMASSSSGINCQFEGTDHADLYLTCRPDWPQEIIQRSLNFLHEKKSKPLELAVDVGCGSGQNTRPLAPHFEKVIGFDVSEAQITAAKRTDIPPNVEFKVGSAENIALPDNSVDLVSCAEAFHWFDLAEFFREVDRILKPSGCVAIYSYTKIQPWVEGDNTKNEHIKQIIHELDGVTLDPYNSDCIRFLEGGMAGVCIPYEENIRDDTVDIRKKSTLASYLAYVRTWSEYQNYLRQNPDGPDLVERLRDQLTEILCLDTPSEETKIQLRGPVILLLGRKPAEIVSF